MELRCEVAGASAGSTRLPRVTTLEVVTGKAPKRQVRDVHGWRDVPRGEQRRRATAFAAALRPSHKEAMLNLLLVAGGGAFGAVCRYVLGIRLFKAFGPGLPYGTFAANLVGGLLMGMLIGVLAIKGGADQERWRLLLGVGVLGGFTTFSSFSLEVALMIERRAYGSAAAYSLASLVLSLVALFFGLFLMRKLLG